MITIPRNKLIPYNRLLPTRLPIEDKMLFRLLGGLAVGGNYKMFLTVAGGAIVNRNSLLVTPSNATVITDANSSNTIDYEDRFGTITDNFRLNQPDSDIGLEKEVIEGKLLEAKLEGYVEGAVGVPYPVTINWSSSRVPDGYVSSGTEVAYWFAQGIPILGNFFDQDKLRYGAFLYGTGSFLIWLVASNDPRIVFDNNSQVGFNNIIAGTSLRGVKFQSTNKGEPSVTPQYDLSTGFVNNFTKIDFNQTDYGKIEIETFDNDGVKHNGTLNWGILGYTKPSAIELSALAEKLRLKTSTFEVDFGPSATYSNGRFNLINLPSLLPKLTLGVYADAVFDARQILVPFTAENADSFSIDFATTEVANDKNLILAYVVVGNNADITFNADNDSGAPQVIDFILTAINRYGSTNVDLQITRLQEPPQAGTFTFTDGPSKTFDWHILDGKVPFTYENVAVRNISVVAGTNDLLEGNPTIEVGGGTGDVLLEFTEVNQTAVDKTATLTGTASNNVGDGVDTIQIIQSKLLVPTLTIPSDRIDVKAHNTEFYLPIEATDLLPTQVSGEFTGDIVKEIEVVELPTSNVDNNSQVKFQINKNVGSARRGEITLIGTNPLGTARDNVPIFQAELESDQPLILFDTEHINIAFEEGIIEVPINVYNATQSNVSFTAPHTGTVIKRNINVRPDITFVSLSNNRGVLRVNVNENTGALNRSEVLTANVNVAGKTDSAILRFIQAGDVCNIVFIGADNRRINPGALEAQIISFEVSGTSALNISSSVAWLNNLSVDASTGLANYNVDANRGTTTRTGQITISGKSSNDHVCSNTYTITQIGTTRERRHVYDIPPDNFYISFNPISLDNSVDASGTEETRAVYLFTKNIDNTNLTPSNPTWARKIDAIDLTDITLNGFTYKRRRIRYRLEANRTLAKRTGAFSLTLDGEKHNATLSQRIDPAWLYLFASLKRDTEDNNETIKPTAQDVELYVFSLNADVSTLALTLTDTATDATPTWLRATSGFSSDSTIVTRGVTWLRYKITLRADLYIGRATRTASLVVKVRNRTDDNTFSHTATLVQTSIIT